MSVQCRHRNPFTTRLRPVRAVRIRDLHLPDPSVVLLHELHGGEVLEGQVIDLSDSGEQGGAFVVIEVNGLPRPCILAVELILRSVEHDQ